MRTFLLQLEPNGHYSEDTAVIARLIDEHNWLYQNDIINIVESSLECLSTNIVNDAIPVGSVQFVNKWLEINQHQALRPLNVPECLRDTIFTRRKITVCPTEDVPQLFDNWNQTELFIKSDEFLKTDWTGIYRKKSFPKDAKKMFGSTCFVSESINFVSEWRCFVLNGELRGIKHYFGDEWIMPDKTFVEMVINTIGMQTPSYTLDIGILDDGTNAVVEIHLMAGCCGLYGFDDMTLLQMLTRAHKHITAYRKTAYPLSLAMGI